MDFSEYQARTAHTAIYPQAGTGNELAVNYTVLSLAGETGEIAGKWSKYYRDAYKHYYGQPENLEEYKNRLKKEVGDLLWHLSQLCTELGIDLGELAQSNLDKLNDRKNRGVLGGSGDNR